MIFQCCFIFIKANPLKDNFAISPKKIKLTTSVVSSSSSRRQRFFKSLHRPPTRLCGGAVGIHVFSSSWEIGEPSLDRFWTHTSSHWTRWMYCGSNFGWLIGKMRRIFITTQQPKFMTFYWYRRVGLCRGYYFSVI